MIPDDDTPRIILQEKSDGKQLVFIPLCDHEQATKAAEKLLTHVRAQHAIEVQGLKLDWWLRGAVSSAILTMLLVFGLKALFEGS